MGGPRCCTGPTSTVGGGSWGGWRKGGLQGVAQLGRKRKASGLSQDPVPSEPHGTHAGLQPLGMSPLWVSAARIVGPRARGGSDITPHPPTAPIRGSSRVLGVHGHVPWGGGGGGEGGSGQAGQPGSLLAHVPRMSRSCPTISRVWLRRNTPGSKPPRHPDSPPHARTSGRREVGLLMVAVPRGRGSPGRATLLPASIPAAMAAEGHGRAPDRPASRHPGEVQPGVVPPLPGGTARGSEQIFSNARRFF